MVTYVVISVYHKEMINITLKKLPESILCLVNFFCFFSLKSNKCPLNYMPIKLADDSYG